MDLPPGFEWRPWNFDHHLHLDGRGIGPIVELPEGRGGRVSWNEGTTNLRFEFLPSREASVRFLERWAAMGGTHPGAALRPRRPAQERRS